MKPRPVEIKINHHAISKWWLLRQWGPYGQLTSTAQWKHTGLHKLHEWLYDAVRDGPVQGVNRDQDDADGNGSSAVVD